MKLPIGYIDLSLGTMLLLLVALRPGGAASSPATVEVAAGAPSAAAEVRLPVVRIAQDGSLMLEGAPLRLDRIPGLRDSLRAVVICPDENVIYGKVAPVLAAFTVAGIGTELEIAK